MHLPRPLLCALVSSALAALAAAQVEHGGQPPSARLHLLRPVPTARMTPVRADLLLAEDAATAVSEKHGPLRFAETLAVDLNLDNSGVWEELGSGSRVWRLRIRSSGAKSLALIFSRYQLPPGGELYVYDDAQKTVRGAYTDLENNLDGEFSIRPLRGDAMTLEYYEPGLARGRGELSISTVAHDYRDVLGLLESSDRSGGGGAAGTCELDTTCPLGVPWVDQAESCVHIIGIAGGSFCSGTLVNNTTNDGALLVLTAAHCGGLTGAVFTFNFEKPGCRSGVAPCTNQIVGGTALLRSEELDVQLLRLNVPAGTLPYRAFLAGWDRSDTIPSNVTLIHHPSGDSKKISQDFDPPAQFQNFWRIKDWDRGASEGGSSGAPLFDPNKRLIGILDSGSSSCQLPANDDFATRLALAWPLLEPYLDPLATGQTTLDGLDVATAPVLPFDVTVMAPPQVETLEPSISRMLRIVGSGFLDSDQIQIDGVTLPQLYYRRGGNSFFNIDLPPVRVGAHFATVIQNGVSRSAPFNVIPCTEPKMQTQNGFFGEKVFSYLGVDTIHADVPGHIHYCIWSLSPLPSVTSTLSLLLGNNFSDMRACQVSPIPATGFIRVHHTMAFGKLPIGTSVYNQSVCVNHGIPFRTTNLQTTVFEQ